MVISMSLVLILMVNLIVVLSDHKIVNGVRTQIETYPFMVGLYYFDQFICAGTIIAPNFVLTAGHCACEEFTTPLTLFVHAGTSNHEGRNTKKFCIESIKCHENLSIEKHQNDIALIKITGTFKKTNTIQSIPLIKRNTEIPVGSFCEIVGWGATQDNENDITPILREAKVPIIDFQTCQAKYKEINVKVTDNMICAGHPDGIQDSCKGDSGGPLIYKGIQIGIVSFGNGCGDANYAGVYVNLSKFINWILCNIEKM